MGMYSPRMYAKYQSCMAQVLAHCGEGGCQYNNSVFPAASYNLGPATATIQYRDFNDFTGGWCAITSGGNYNPQLGGHLVISALRLVIEFPLGSTIEIPSALLDHPNVAVQPGEECFSFTQYCAGALFRWLDFGCRSESDCAKQDPKNIEQVRAQGKSRFSTALGDFSTVEELKERVRGAKTTHPSA